MAGDDPIELLRAVAPRVVSAHASDRYLLPGASLEDLRGSDGAIGYFEGLEHGVTGRGLNDYDAIFQILSDVGFEGWISIEDGMNGMEDMQAFARIFASHAKEVFRAAAIRHLVGASHRVARRITKTWGAAQPVVRPATICRGDAVSRP